MAWKLSRFPSKLTVWPPTATPLFVARGTGPSPHWIVTMWYQVPPATTSVTVFDAGAPAVHGAAARRAPGAPAFTLWPWSAVGLPATFVLFATTKSSSAPDDLVKSVAQAPTKLPFATLTPPFPAASKPLYVSFAYFQSSQKPAGKGTGLVQLTWSAAPKGRTAQLPVEPAPLPDRQLHPEAPHRPADAHLVAVAAGALESRIIPRNDRVVLVLPAVAHDVRPLLLVADDVAKDAARVVSATPSIVGQLRNAQTPCPARSVMS